MKARDRLAVCCAMVPALLISAGAWAQYIPSFSIDTIAALGGYDVKGTAVDDDGTIYLLDPVCDRVLKTNPAGQLLGSFSTIAVGCYDGQGLAMDPALNRLYIVDPVCDRVFITTIDGILLASFGTEAFGCFDANGADWNPATNELFLLDPVGDKIFVTNAAGTLQRTLPLEPFACRDGRGLACDPGRNALLVVDPVVDQVFEMGAATGVLYRRVGTEAYGLFDVNAAGFLPPSTLVLTDPVCDRTRGFGLPRDFASHNVGNMVLTMTDQGGLGFLDDSQTAGSGLVYPAGTSNRLFVGSLWVGSDPTYVANRDYTADPAQEWTLETDPLGGIVIQQPGPDADQEIRAGFDDNLAASGMDPLSVRQESWAYGAAPQDRDFVIVRYFIANQGTALLTGLRAGIFLDIDIEPFQSNTGSTDPTRKLVYMVGGGVHVGAALLAGDQSPDPLANLSLINNPTFVYPQNYMLDADKFGFLSASDPAHSVPNAPVPNDYGLIASVGPFNLAPGQSNEIAIAIAGGTSLAALQAHVDRAQAVYLSHTTGIEGAPDAAGLTRLLSVAPNPFNPATTIRYELARPGAVQLTIYDPLGRAVRTLVDERRPAGRHEIAWDGRGDGGQAMASGVYFLRLDADGAVQTRPLVLLK